MIKNIVFAGTPEVAAQVFRELLQQGLNIIACYTQPDRPSGRNLKLQASPVKKVAEQYHIPVLQPKNFKDPTTLEEFKNLAPELMLVFAYGLILPQKVLAVPKFGCVNIHTSLLPRWRGAAPVQHAILAGDQLTGVSIMQMEPSLDTGKILHAISCPILPTDTAGDLYAKLQPLATTAILTVIEKLINQQIDPVTQDEQQATYAHKINKLDAKLIWTKPAIELARMIRAFIPDPVCFAEFRSTSSEVIPLRIWQSSVIEQCNDLDLLKFTKNFVTIPGNILKLDKLGIYVATGQGILRLEKVQFAGGKILSGLDLSNTKKYIELFTNGKFA